jgi:hypothetical protein
MGITRIRCREEYAALNAELRVPPTTALRATSPEGRDPSWIEHGESRCVVTAFSFC